MRKRKPSTDLFPSSLLTESQRVLEEEFTRLPNRIQTGYTLVFWNHNELIRHNTHNRRTDSFPMDTEEVTHYFADPRNFRAVNDNGYYLNQKNTRHGIIEGQYALLRKEAKGVMYCEPTKWIIKTIDAFQSWSEVGVIGTKNGYILDSKVKRFVDAWIAQTESELPKQRGMINRRGDSAKQIAKYYGGAIRRDLSKVSKRVNIRVLIKVDIDSLLLHKKQLNNTLNKLNNYGVEELIKESDIWLKVLEEMHHIEAREEGAEAPAEKERALGGVKVKNIYSKALKSLAMKDFNRKSINERIDEITKVLTTIREENSSTIPIFYEEAKTGRYTAKNAILQGYHRSVRYAALRGCYEYDLEAAHQNILVQLLDREKIDFPELDVLREYVKDKKKIREELSKTLMTSVETVKQLIQALTYGAQLVRNKKQSIYDICEGDQELIERVITNPWLEKLAKTFLIAHKHLIGDKKILKNAVGIKSETLSGKAEAMAHILQGYERLVLDTLIRHSKPKDVALLIHDCIVYYTPKNTSDLSSIVYENTGFNLEFSEEPY